MGKTKSPIESQMNKFFRHTRAGSYGTRARYRSSCNKFVSFLDKEFKMKNLRNLQDKHLVAYIDHRQLIGIAPKTLKNDLGAIRYMHDLISNAKHELSDNEGLKEKYDVELEKTYAVKGDRAWTDKEYQNMQSFTQQKINKGDKGAMTARDVRDVIRIARTMGLRVTEAVAMRRSQVEQALRTGVYQVKNEAKNGKWREVPLSNEAQKLLERRIKEVPRGSWIFIDTNEKTHQAVNRLEKFLYNHREKIETEEGRKLRTWKNDKGEVITNELNFHGLRYNYVQHRMAEEMDKGFDKKQAALIVTKEVGHERIGVINVYLGGK